MIPATIGEILKEVPAVKMAAIPTMFESIEFRSRLEAKWSAIFTEFGWHWTYEPFDLGCWSPDFQLEWRILVEVKPFSFAEQWGQEVAKIRRAMIDNEMIQEVLLIGADLLPPIEGYSNQQLGWLLTPGDPRYDEWDVDNAMLYQFDGRFDFSAECGVWRSRLNRAHVRKWIHHPVNPADIAAIVGRATNAVKWRPQP